MNGTNSNTSGSSVADVDFAKKAGTDCIPDSTMDEIARRLQVTFESLQDGNVVFAPSPPADTSKIWWQTDANGIPIGSPLKYDNATNQWVPVALGGNSFVPARRRFGRFLAPAGDSTKTLEFADMGTSDYLVTLTPTTFDGNTWAPAPTNFPGHFGWILANRSPTSVTVFTKGAPTGGIYFEVDIEERITTAQ